MGTLNLFIKLRMDRLLWTSMSSFFSFDEFLELRRNLKEEELFVRLFSLDERLFIRERLVKVGFSVFVKELHEMELFDPSLDEELCFLITLLEIDFFDSFLGFDSSLDEELLLLRMLLEADFFDSSRDESLAFLRTLLDVDLLTPFLEDFTVSKLSLDSPLAFLISLLDDVFLTSFVSFEDSLAANLLIGALCVT